MTKIAYADETWNPFAGCSQCSPGCAHCYAARAACGRFLKDHPLYKGLAVNNTWTGEVRLCTDIGRTDILDKPLHWKKPRTIFLGNMGDLFYPKVPFEFIDKIMAVIWELNCREIWHNLLILTKRPKRMLDYHNSRPWPRVAAIIKSKFGRNWAGGRLAYPEHLYLGATICNQAEADEKIPILLQIPAAKRWLSIEPMLGPVDFEKFIWKENRNSTSALYGMRVEPTQLIDWVVLGCESGPKRRPCDIDWMIDVVEQCKAAGVKCFVKQVNINGRVSHNMDEWPEKLRVREKI